jgi:hypothetical protein
MAIPPPPLARLLPRPPPVRPLYDPINFRHDTPPRPPLWAPMVPGDPRHAMFNKKDIDFYFFDKPVPLRFQFSSIIWLRITNTINLWDSLNHEQQCQIVSFLENRDTYSELQNLPATIMTIVHSVYREMVMQEGYEDPFVLLPAARINPVNGVNVYNKYLKYKNKYLKLKDLHL